jgi:hypothetical protein
MRAILRFSIDNERTSALRNALAKILVSAGFVLSGKTATYEHANISEADMAKALNDFWARAANHGGSGTVDHFWMYTDTVPTAPMYTANTAAMAALNITFPPNDTDEV